MAEVLQGEESQTVVDGACGDTNNMQSRNQGEKECLKNANLTTIQSLQKELMDSSRTTITLDPKDILDLLNKKENNSSSNMDSLSPEICRKDTPTFCVPMYSFDSLEDNKILSDESIESAPGKAYSSDLSPSEVSEIEDDIQLVAITVLDDKDQLAKVESGEQCKYIKSENFASSSDNDCVFSCAEDTDTAYGKQSTETDEANKRKVVEQQGRKYKKVQLLKIQPDGSYLVFDEKDANDSEKSNMVFFVPSAKDKPSVPTVPAATQSHLNSTLGSIANSFINSIMERDGFLNAAAISMRIPDLELETSAPKVSEGQQVQNSVTSNVFPCIRGDSFVCNTEASNITNADSLNCLNLNQNHSGIPAKGYGTYPKTTDRLTSRVVPTSYASPVLGQNSNNTLVRIGAEDAASLIHMPLQCSTGIFKNPCPVPQMTSTPKRPTLMAPPANFSYAPQEAYSGTPHPVITGRTVDPPSSFGNQPASFSASCNRPSYSDTSQHDYMQEITTDMETSFESDNCSRIGVSPSSLNLSYRPLRVPHNTPYHGERKVRPLHACDIEEVLCHSPPLRPVLGRFDRTKHNAKERARRARVKIACDLLREIVPGMTSRTDKATVFEYAYEYVKYLKKTAMKGHEKDFLLNTIPVVETVEKAD